MDFIVSLKSDVGCKRKVNQDAAAAFTAQTAIGNVFFGLVCDGMGGLSQGEVASATVVNCYSDWFRNEFADLISENTTPEIIIDKVIKKWERILYRCHDTLFAYGTNKGIKLGTTCSCLLIAPMWYCILHIGDSRIYFFNTNEIRQLTKDHTFIARELERGTITEEEALTHPKRHALTQSVGASSTRLVPDISFGSLEENTVFLICSDGYRNRLSSDELFSYYNPPAVNYESDLDYSFNTIIEQCIYRGETDNLTAVSVKVV